MIIPTYTHSPHAGHQSGFTLIELLVTVSIAAVLLAIGIPSFQGISATSQLSSQTNDMVSALNLARSEAIKRGARVSVCMSSDGTSCATTGDWDQGWIIFVDTTRSGTDAAVDTGETVLAVRQSNGSTVTIKGSTDLTKYVSYASDGRARLMGGTTQNGTLRVCSASSALTNANRARDIAISASGRIATTTPSSVATTCPTP